MQRPDAEGSTIKTASADSTDNIDQSSPGQQQQQEQQQPVDVDDDNSPLIPPQSRLDLVKAMVSACRYKDLDCPVCAQLQEKFDDAAFADTDGVESVVMDSTALLELEQSRQIRKQFQARAQAHLVARKQGSSIDVPSNRDFDASIPGMARQFNSGPEDLGITDDGSDSRMSELNEGGLRAEPLSYGLHHLIRDIEQKRNHRLVFDQLKPEQLRSLLAHVACKETLWKEMESDARLLRIEQELSDLADREDMGKAAAERQSSVGGHTSTSKKSSPDQSFY